MSDMFQSQAEAWVCTVNCVGVMGAGIAKKFANLFDGVLYKYRAACNDKMLRPGEILPLQQPFFHPRWIVCFATKDHWKSPSKLVWVESGLDSLALWCKEKQIQSIAVPALGCGLGGLDWRVVRPMIVDRLGFVESLEIYDPWR